jgi:hypothetical protein
VIVEDNEHGLKNRAPMKEDQRFVLLAPQNESYSGPQYDHNPVSAGEVPADPLGYFSQGTEVSDKVFRQWPEDSESILYGNVKPNKKSRQLFAPPAGPNVGSR